MKKIIILSAFIIIFIIVLACTSQAPEKEEALPPDRLSKIPEDTVKIKPEDDLFPPILHSDLWQEPAPMSATINSAGGEDSPFITPDGKELWITRMYNGCPAVFRSIEDTGGSWNEPELIISQFAGEATLDNGGNIYFTHHFYKDSIMLEADIYVAYKK